MSVEEFPSISSANQHAAPTTSNYLKMIKINGVCCLPLLQYTKSYLKTIPEQLWKTQELVAQHRA